MITQKISIDKTKSYCNYCKHFLTNVFSNSWRGVCFEFPEIDFFEPPHFPCFFNEPCKEFSYSPIRNAFALTDPSYIKLWKSAYQIRHILHRDIEEFRTTGELKSAANPNIIIIT